MHFAKCGFLRDPLRKEVKNTCCIIAIPTCNNPEDKIFKQRYISTMHMAKECMIIYLPFRIWEN